MALLRKYPDLQKENFRSTIRLMERQGQQGQIVFSKTPVPKAIETDPTVKPVGPVRERLFIILSDKPNQYEEPLEAYADAPEVSGQTLINATPYTGDIGKIEDITGPLPAHLENIRRPFKRGNEYFLRRPGELIYVGPKQPNNPFLKTPADLKKY